MTTEEKKIEEAAKTYAGFNEDQDPNDPDNRYYATSNCRKYDDFVTGAKSDAAKEYHTKGMFTEEQLDERLDFQAWETTVQVIKNIGKMITKDEVLSFFDKYEPNIAVTILKSEFVEWFDKTKTK